MGTTQQWQCPNCGPSRRQVACPNCGEREDIGIEMRAPTVTRWDTQGAAAMVGRDTLPKGTATAPPGHEFVTTLTIRGDHEQQDD